MILTIRTEYWREQHNLLPRANQAFLSHSYLHPRLAGRDFWLVSLPVLPVTSSPTALLLGLYDLLSLGSSHTKSIPITLSPGFFLHISGLGLPELLCLISLAESRRWVSGALG